MRRSHLVVAGVLGLIVAVLLVWKLRGGGDDEAGGPGGAGGSDDQSSMAGGGKGRTKDGPQAPASLSGRVTRAADGSGVANATVAIDRVQLMPMFDDRDDEPATLATTDATGAWTVPVIAPGTYEVAATAAGLIPADKKISINSGDKATVDLALAAGGTVVSGTVTDATGGPIRGARVTLSRESGQIFGGKASLITLTDKDGKYSVSLAPGHYWAVATHEDYTRAFKSFELRGESITIDFMLAPGSSIRGSVVTREGKPVPNAHVRASGHGFRDFGKTAKTDDTGAFTITGLGSGAIKLTASGKGFATTAPTVVELGIGEQIDGVKIVVDKAYTISGRVVRAQKQSEGIEGVTLGVFSFGGGGDLATTADPSDSTGKFEIHGVKPGNYMMFAIGEGTVPEVKMGVDVVDKDVTDIVIEMTTGATLAGRVEFGGGEKVTAQLSLQFDETKIGLGNMFDMMKSVVVHGETDATGAFTLKSAPPGEFKLVARTADGRRGELPIVVTTADQTGLVVKLEPRASIAGKVVDERGAAVAGVHVDIQKDRRSGGMVQMDWGNRGGALTGVDGGFEIVGLEEGKLKLAVSDDFGRVPFVGKDKDKPYEVELSKGQKLTGVTLTIEARDGVIRGIVIGTDKQPVADAWVSARLAIDPAAGKRAMMMGMWRESEPILTGSDGKFTLDHLHRGSYDLEVEGPKGASRAARKGVKTGETVTLVLESLGSITGKVTLGGVPVTEFDLGCHVEGPGRRFDSDTMSRRFTGADGTYTLERLQPGEYSCSVTSNGGTATGKVVVAVGPSKLDLALQPWATITGVVIDAVTNKPIPNLIVLVSGDAMDGKQFADVLQGKGPTTDATGRFLVERVPIGKGQCHVAPKDATFNHLATRDFTATAGQRIDLGTIKLVMPHDNEGGTLGFFPGVVDGKLVVADVKPDTAAEKAGVQDDDRITSINGRPVVTGDNAPDGSLTADLGKQMLMPGSLPVGQPYKLGLERAGKPLEVTIVSEKF